MNKKVFNKTFIVPASAIDTMGHVNNLTYLEWCLKAAQGHWKSLADDAVLKKYIWYVLEHQIRYKTAAFEGDELQIETWVTTAEGVRSERKYKIHRPSDGKTIVEAQTLWCLLDAHTEKPTAITEEIRTLFL